MESSRFACAASHITPFRVRVQYDPRRPWEPSEERNSQLPIDDRCYLRFESPTALRSQAIRLRLVVSVSAQCTRGGITACRTDNRRQGLRRARTARPIQHYT